MLAPTFLMFVVFCFGEVDRLYCLTQQVAPGIKGEDVANIMMNMKNGIHCFVEMSLCEHLRKGGFPGNADVNRGQQWFHSTYSRQ